MSDELDCDDLPLIRSGAAPLVSDPENGCPSELSGLGVMITDLTGTSHRDGSNDSPVEIPGIVDSSQEHDATFPMIAFFNESGRLLSLRAFGGSAEYHLVAKNGQFQLRPVTGKHCFDEDAICECNDVDFIAGWQKVETAPGSGVFRYCLTRIRAGDSLSDDWESTDSARVSGSGVDGDPYSIDVAISPDDEQILEQRQNGLFAKTPWGEIPISSHPGNLIQLLPDGLYVGSITS